MVTIELTTIGSVPAQRISVRHRVRSIIEAATSQCAGRRTELEGTIGLSQPHKAPSFMLTPVLCQLMIGSH